MVTWDNPKTACPRRGCNGTLRMHWFCSHHIVAEKRGCQGNAICDTCRGTLYIWPEDCSGPPAPVNPFNGQPDYGYCGRCTIECFATPRR